MKLGLKLQRILDAELKAGNSIKGSYANAFANCDLLIILNGPFRVVRDGTENVRDLEAFENNDAHYPVGRGYLDKTDKSIILAPM